MRKRQIKENMKRNSTSKKKKRNERVRENECGRT